MNILFYCPFNFNIKSSKLKSLGGIESLNVELSKFLSKSNKSTSKISNLFSKSLK